MSCESHRQLRRRPYQKCWGQILFGLILQKTSIGQISSSTGRIKNFWAHVIATTMMCLIELPGLNDSYNPHFQGRVGHGVCGRVYKPGGAKRTHPLAWRFEAEIFQIFVMFETDSSEGRRGSGLWYTKQFQREWVQSLGQPSKQCQRWGYLSAA